MSKFILPLRISEKRRRFEMSKVSQLGHGKIFVLKKICPEKSIAIKYYKKKILQHNVGLQCLKIKVLQNM